MALIQRSYIKFRQILSPKNWPIIIITLVIKKNNFTGRWTQIKKKQKLKKEKPKKKKKFKRKESENSKVESCRKKGKKTHQKHFSLSRRTVIKNEKQWREREKFKKEKQVIYQRPTRTREGSFDPVRKLKMLIRKRVLPIDQKKIEVSETIFQRR